MAKIKFLDEGTTAERAAMVVDALAAGFSLRQSKSYGAHLVDPAKDQIIVVSRPVMEYLIRHNLIERKA
jgi:hypothetical protein